MVKHGDQQLHNFRILTDNCRPRRSEDNYSSCCTLQENIRLLAPSDEKFSTTLCLYHQMWIENNRSLVESSARNYAASEERTRFLKEVFDLQQRERATEILMSRIQQQVFTRNDGTGPRKQKTPEPSTGLTIFDQSWINNNPALANASLQIYAASKNKRKLSTQEIEEEKEVKQLRLSENMVLYPDPFNITKTLRRSDLNDLCRLLIGEKSINNHVFPMWSVEDINKAKSKVGLKVDVWDQNTNSSHKLVLKHWSKWNAYVFINKWRPDIVVRRGLNVGDKIGLYWDQINKRFTFNVLQRAAAT